jgi:N6-L-threonylcarbamoyladenine synthase
LAATDSRTLVIAGGVGANRRLRARMSAMGERDGVRVVYPRIEFCTDNAAMIALLGHLRLSPGNTTICRARPGTLADGHAGAGGMIAPGTRDGRS